MKHQKMLIKVDHFFSSTFNLNIEVLPTHTESDESQDLLGRWVHKATASFGTDSKVFLSSPLHHVSCSL